MSEKLLSLDEQLAQQSSENLTDIDRMYQQMLAEIIQILPEEMKGKVHVNFPVHSREIS